MHTLATVISISTLLGLTMNTYITKTFSYHHNVWYSKRLISFKSPAMFVLINVNYYLGIDYGFYIRDIPTAFF